MNGLIIAPTVVAVAMLSDTASLILFLATTVLVSVGLAFILPRQLARLHLGQLIPILAVVGPALCALFVLMGAGTMVLAGHDGKVVIMMAAVIGVSVAVLGRRLAHPLAQDLTEVSCALQSLAAGNRKPADMVPHTADTRTLMSAVEDLRRSLVASEAERDRAELHRRAVVAGLSHDLRTPLHNMLAAAEALADPANQGDLVHPEAGLNARHIAINARALDRLVNDLFLTAQAEGGYLRLDHQDVELSELVEEIVEAAIPAAAARGVTLGSTVDQRVVATGDEMAIGRILGNLIDNAVRHTPAGGSVMVSIDQNFGRAAVSVLDGGPGFPAEVETFARLENPGPARPPGSHGGAGLGLSIASTLANAVGGSVEVKPGSPGLAIAYFNPARA